MPIYEFDCQNCRQKFETLAAISGIAAVVCPFCTSPHVKKRFSSFGIGGSGSRLKNSGSSCRSCSSTDCSTCGK